MAGDIKIPAALRPGDAARDHQQRPDGPCSREQGIKANTRTLFLVRTAAFVNHTGISLFFAPTLNAKSVTQARSLGSQTLNPASQTPQNGQPAALRSLASRSVGMRDAWRELSTWLVSVSDRSRPGGGMHATCPRRYAADGCQKGTTPSFGGNQTALSVEIEIR